MRKFSKYLYAILIVSMISASFACEKSNNGNKEFLCFYFDQRQCAGDEWANLIVNNNSWQEREQAMKDYLESQNIEVKDIYISPLFHEGVCEACYVCPEQHRLFVKIEAGGKTQLESLDLLNFGEGDCQDLFK